MPSKKGDLKVKNALTTVNKGIYEQPKVQVCVLSVQDVVTTSAPEKDWTAEWDPI